ncbi:MAG: hypothetical protein AAFW75_29530, partial [Cyanobacteria bacterium J06636_16]
MMKQVIATGLLPVLLMSTGCANAAAQHEAPTATLATFTEWCLNQASLSAAVQHTIDLLLEKAETADCDQADAVLMDLTWLNLSEQAIIDVTPLASLTHLTGLDLTDNAIVDITPLASLTGLTELLLDDNRITDVTPLANLPQLTALLLLLLPAYAEEGKVYFSVALGCTGGRHEDYNWGGSNARRRSPPTKPS